MELKTFSLERTCSQSYWSTDYCLEAGQSYQASPTSPQFWRSLSPLDDVSLGEAQPIYPPTSIPTTRHLPSSLSLPCSSTLHS